ncbi:MAG TPA: FAD-dependent thymidylate synthase [Candidatus Nitrosotalea sp.]|nr:FAD-dependent thymidylate synthase [Candidatus Nitrosotalea sp.]
MPGPVESDEGVHEIDSRRGVQAPRGRFPIASSTLAEGVPAVDPEPIRPPAAAHPGAIGSGAAATPAAAAAAAENVRQVLPQRLDSPFVAGLQGGEFSDLEQAALEPYFTNLDRPVFALRNLPEVVKGALFSRYSRTEKSLRRVLLEEFLEELAVPPGSTAAASRDPVAAARAESFYERVLVGYGDDSVAELAGAHLALEGVSTLAAKSLEGSRIGISPLEKSTRYVRFDRPGSDGRSLYHRAPELDHPAYEPSMDRLFSAYSELLEPLIESIRLRHPHTADESERAWRSATRAKALDLLRGLLPASTLTNLGLYGNGRALEYLITKMAADPLPECRSLALQMQAELNSVIPAFVRRALDERHGRPAADRLRDIQQRVGRLAPAPRPRPDAAGVRLLDFDPGAEEKVVVAALFPHSDLGWEELRAELPDPGAVLDAVLDGRQNRRQRLPRALEQAVYGFEVVANFAAYRDLQRHRMLSQDRQLLGVDLGYDVPEQLSEYGLQDAFRAAIEQAESAQRLMSSAIGPELAQYAVPLAYRVRWYIRANLREIVHLCELRTTPQGHPDYRRLAQQMFRLVAEVHPRLARAGFVDLGPGDALERRASERRLDHKREALGEQL